MKQFRELHSKGEKLKPSTKPSMVAKVKAWSVPVTNFI